MMGKYLRGQARIEIESGRLRDQPMGIKGVVLLLADHMRDFDHQNGAWGYLYAEEEEIASWLGISRARWRDHYRKKLLGLGVLQQVRPGIKLKQTAGFVLFPWLHPDYEEGEPLPEPMTLRGAI